MRDNLWLKEKLDSIWGILFKDVERKNNIIIKFKGKWKNKFGHIKSLKNKDTEIAINALFKDSIVPEYILDLTIAHELVHYSHGFHSPLPKLYKHPHKGGIVTRELKSRGFSHSLRLEREFLKKDWIKIYEKLVNDRKKP